MGIINRPVFDVVTFTRASAATRINALGVLESVAANVPRIDYDPVTLAVRGLLVEEQRTNLILQSNQFQAYNAALSGNESVSNVLGISGPASAKRYVISVDGFVELNLNANQTIVPGTAYVYSIYAKSNRVIGSHSGGESPIRDLTNGGAIPAVATTAPAPKGFTRYSWAFTAPAGCVSSRFRVFYNSAVVGDWFEVEGAQLEAGGFPTSYIQTSGAQVTRAADVAKINTLSPWYNAAEGTLFAEFVRAGINPANKACSFARLYGDGGNYISIESGFGTPRDQRVQIVTGGVAQAMLVTNAAAAVAGTIYKMATGIKANDFGASENGGAAITDYGGAVPAVNMLLIGSDTSEGQMNGHIRRVRYYPKRLTNAELQALTA